MWQYRVPAVHIERYAVRGWYAGKCDLLLISQVITKESHEDFMEEELFAVKSVAYADEAGAGNYSKQ